jgi:hypothetical protein
MRRAIRIERRMYESRGVHHLWHLDGNHKLSKWGFVIHGCVDGFSRFITFLRVATNNYSGTVLANFRLACKQLRATPARVRGDRGGENVRVADYMVIVRGANRRSYLPGSSTYNTRIERLWRDLRQQLTQRFIQLFYSWEQDPRILMDAENLIHMYALQHLFLPVLRRAVHQFLCTWNHHRLRTEHHRTPAQLLHLNGDAAPAAPTVVDPFVYPEDDEDDELLYDSDEEFHAALQEAQGQEEDVEGEAVPQVVVDDLACPLDAPRLAHFVENVQPVHISDTNAELLVKYVHAVTLLSELYYAEDV